MLSQCTKFEVSGFTRYEAMNGGAKCRKWGGLGCLGALKVMGNATIRQSAYDFLFDFNRNHASILYRFRDIAGQSPILTHPTCIWRPAGGDPGRISRRSLAPENQSPWGIVWCCLCDRAFCRFSRTPACDRHGHRQTQTQTDIGSSAHGQYHRGCIASRGKNDTRQTYSFYYECRMHGTV